jgi:polyisoprenoid-binding protein YceI
VVVGKVRKQLRFQKKIEPGEKPENAVVANIDAERSTIGWMGTKITGQHDGTIGLANGELYLIGDQLVGGNIVLDMAAIVVLDIEDPQMNARLQGHLQSDDFFSTESFPEATFEMANIVKLEEALTGEPNYTISGNLTIKGITHGVTFPAYVEVENDVVTANADFDLDRTMWDVKFGSGRFYENLGDNLIHDNFNIKLDITARK